MFRAEDSSEEEAELELVDEDVEEHPRSRVHDYFQLLQIANETGSVPPTPRTRSTTPLSGSPRPHSCTPDNAGCSEDSQSFRAESMAEGYFKTFFQEECRLGMGANGSVYLCQVNTPSSTLSPVAEVFIRFSMYLTGILLVGILRFLSSVHLITNGRSLT